MANIIGSFFGGLAWIVTEAIHKPIIAGAIFITLTAIIKIIYEHIRMQKWKRTKGRNFERWDK